MNERVLVCGGRSWQYRAVVFAALDRLHETRRIKVLMQGGAEGADALAKEWARDRCVPFMEFPADWRRHGKKAGPMRNQQMLEEGNPTLVAAFPGGRGTADMQRKARAFGVTILEFQDSGPISAAPHNVQALENMG